MDESIFDTLIDLLQSPGPVNWKLADEAIKSVGGPSDPIEPVMAEEYSDLTLAAELMIAKVPGLASPAATPMNPVDRTTWARENAQSFRYLIEPLAMKLSGNLGSGPLEQLGPALLGMQAGTMVGLMSHRIFGQFDTGLPTVDHNDRYLVVGNVEEFAHANHLDVKQVRLWAVLHEVLHHAILDTEWYRQHFLQSMENYFSGVEFDPTVMQDMMKSLQSASDMQDMLSSGPPDITSMIGMKSDRQRLSALQAVIAITEGFADWAVERAASEILPNLAQIAEAADQRRAESHQGAELMQQLAGLNLQRHQASVAAEFCRELARRLGDEALTTLWAAPDNLPTLDELVDPVGWAARVLL